MAQYPPIIAASLQPAIYKTIDYKDYIYLTVPFEFGRATNVQTIQSIKWIIKSSIQNTQITAGEIRNSDSDFTETIQNKIINLRIAVSDIDVSTTIPIEDYFLGNYFKIQIAFISDVNTVNVYYSTAGTFKIIDDPKITLSENGGTWVGKYSSKYSSLESSQFILKRAHFNTVLENSKIIYHDPSNMGVEQYRFQNTLEFNERYDIEWVVTNDEGSQFSVVCDNIAGNTELLLTTTNFSLITKNDPESGSISLGIYQIDDEGSIIEQDPESVRDYGTYVIIKSSSEDNFKSWKDLYTFDSLSSYYLTNNLSDPLFLIQDSNIKFGIVYQYAIQKQNENGVRSVKRKGDLLTANFEHTYLSDDTKQLCLKFNPQVSSMKTVVMESKQNTLGGAYPIIFRNGETNYKEFNISGLITHLQDPEGLFGFSDFDSGSPITTNLTYENFAKEQKFKLEVLEWLNNGKPKLLRSPSEGSYSVQLMNVSLSPLNQLGRMLHTFSATAVEVEEKVEGAKKVTLPSLPPGVITWYPDSSDGDTIFGGPQYKIKEILFYNFLTMTDDGFGDSDGNPIPGHYPAHLVHNNDVNNFKLLYVGPAGYRYTVEGDNWVSGIMCKSKGDGEDYHGKIRLDIYYDYVGNTEEDDFFDGIKKIETIEQIGQFNFSTNTDNNQNRYITYYKVLTITKKSFEDSSAKNNTITYIDSDNIEHSFYINSQLTLEDLMVKEMSWGSNLILSYCRVAVNRYERGG